MSTSLDILLTRPLRTLETRGTKYEHETLNKTGQTSRPYASIATVFLFTRKIILNAPRVSSFDICLLKKGSEGLAYRISRKGEAVRLPKSIGRLGPPMRYGKKQRISILMQVTPNLVTNIRARTHLVGAFPPLMLPR